jgi:hypothetical protein
MRRNAKAKTVATRVPLRKSAMSANPAARRPFPAWIDAAEGHVTFSAATVMPRVRDGLVLRTVAKKKAATAKPKGKSSDAHGAR